MHQRRHEHSLKYLNSENESITYLNVWYLAETLHQKRSKYFYLY